MATLQPAARRGTCYILALICAAAFSSPCLQPEVAFAGQRPSGAQRSAVVMQAKAAKKAPSGYNLFTQEKLSDPEYRLAAMEQGKDPFTLCGEQWKSLPAAEKAKYLAQSEETAIATGVGKPRKAMSGYNLFCKQRLGDPAFRATAEGKGVNPMKACGEEWRALSKTEKAKLNDEAKSMKDTDRGVRSTMGKTLSGYNLFTREQFEKTSGATLSSIGASWRSLSDSEKEEYKKRAVEVLETEAKEKEAKKTNRKLTAYAAFIKSQAGNVAWKASGMPFMKAMAAQWKSMTDDEKEAWKTYASGL